MYIYGLSTLRLLFNLLFDLLVNYPTIVLGIIIGYIIWYIGEKYYDYFICNYYLYNINKHCSVCLDDCKANYKDPNCVLLKCKHTFHIDCIKRWILSGQTNNIRCPMCRSELLNNENKKF